MEPILILQFCTTGPYIKTHLNKQRRFGSNGRMLQFTPRRHEIRNSLRSVKIQLSSFRSQVSGLRSQVSGLRSQVSGLPPSLLSELYRSPSRKPLMSPSGLPAAGYPASARWHVFRSPPSILKPICPARKLLPDFLKGFTLLKTI